MSGLSKQLSSSPPSDLNPGQIPIASALSQSHLDLQMLSSTPSTSTAPGAPRSFGANDRLEPIIIESSQQQTTDHFLIPNHYKECVSSVLISHGMIMDRVQKLAKDIREAYDGKTIHLLCVLKGGSAFFQDLQVCLRNFHQFSKQTDIPFTFDFIRAKSYAGTESTGTVKVSGCDLEKLKGKHVLLVEDIVDTGTTMSYLIPLLATYNPASLRVTSLLEKRTPRSCGFKADFVGFSVPDEFVIGYCLDYNDAFRDMQHICVISKDGIEKYRNGVPDS